MRIATRKPRSTSPRTCSGGTWTPSKTSRPIGCGESELDRLAAEAGRVARDPEGGDARGRRRPPSCGRRPSRRRRPARWRCRSSRRSAGSPRRRGVGRAARAPRRRCPRRARSARSRRPPRPSRAAAPTRRPRSGWPDCSRGNEPRPWTANAVSASVQWRASPSRIRQSSIAPTSGRQPSSSCWKSRPSSPVAASSRDERPVERALVAARAPAAPCARAAAVVVVSSSSSWSGCRWASSSGVDIATTAVIARPPRARPAP